MLRHIVSGAVIIAASISPVLAADLIIEEEDVFVPEAVADDWSGFYVGGHVGFGWGNVDVTDEVFMGDIEPFDASGFLIGAQIGANIQMDALVVGVVADAAWANISGDSLEVGVDTITTDVDWLATIRGRLGFAADMFLIYGTAGIAFAGVDTTLTESWMVPNPTFTDSATRTGWVAGIGAEAMVAENVSIFGEVLYHDFGTDDHVFEVGDEEATTSLNVTTVKIGANFHF